MHRALLMAYQYVLDLVLIEQRVVYEQHRSTRIPENVLDAFFLQTLDGDFCARQFHGNYLN